MLSDSENCYLYPLYVKFIHFDACESEIVSPSVFLPGESQGRRSLVGCHLWSHTQSDTTEAT